MAFDLGFDVGRSCPGCGGNGLVDIGGATGSDGAYGELGLGGRAELAGDSDAQFTMELPRDFCGDGDAATRDAEDDGLVQLERAKCLGELAAGIATVLEREDGVASR